jgi:hypothetical protein
MNLARWSMENQRRIEAKDSNREERRQRALEKQ